MNEGKREMGEKDGRKRMHERETQYCAVFVGMDK
jgi:hypothetical protein